MRNINDLNILTVKHDFATKCILYSIPKCIDSLPPLIKDKLLTHSYSGVIFYTRNYFINCYQSQCFVSNCYKFAIDKFSLYLIVILYCTFKYDLS